MELRRSLAASVVVPMSWAAFSVAVKNSTMGSLLGVGRKARPFLRTVSSMLVKVTDDWLYSHRSVGSVVGGVGVSWVGRDGGLGVTRWASLCLWRSLVTS